MCQQRASCARSDIGGQCQETYARDAQRDPFNPLATARGRISRQSPERRHGRDQLDEAVDPKTDERDAAGDHARGERNATFDDHIEESHVIQLASALEETCARINGEGGHWRNLSRKD